MLVGLLPSWLLWSLAGVSAGLAAWLWTRQARTGTLTAALCAVLFAGFTTPMMRSLASGQEADYRLLSGVAGGVMRGDSFEQIIADNMDALTDGLEADLEVFGGVTGTDTSPLDDVLDDVRTEGLTPEGTDL